ncbi:MAG: MFS transporter [Streptosporangiales bacterium]|nr:MFS transporter [Streptosporangiales bacterium]
MPPDMLLAEPPAAVAGTPRRKVWTLIVTCAAVALVMCMVTTVSTALPDLAASLKASQSQQTWIVDAYTVVLAALVLPAGALGDRYGRRGTLVGGLAVFALGCALPLATDSVSLMIVARAVTGLGAAFIMPSTLSLVTESYPAGGRGRAIGIWAATAGLGGLIGVVLTGLVLQHYSWHGVFVVPALVALVLAAAGLGIPSSPEAAVRRLDGRGSVLSALAVGVLIFGILESANDGWSSPLVIGALAAAVVLGAGFAWAELRRAEPMLDVRLFRSPVLTLGTVSVTLQFTAAFGVMYAVTQYFQLVQGYSPLGSGIALWPVAVVMLPVAPFSARLAEKIGVRPVTFAGLLGVAAGTFLIGLLGPHSGYVPAGIAVGVLGGGIGLASPAGTSAIMDSVPADSYGVGSALNDVTRELGAALGIALAGSILSDGYTRQITAAAAHLPPSARSAVTSSVAAALPAAAKLGPQGKALAASAKAAFCHGMWLSSLTLAILVAAGAVFILFLRPRAPRP